MHISNLQKYWLSDNLNTVLPENFCGELNLAVWQIDQPTAKLNSAKISSVRIYV